MHGVVRRRTRTKDSKRSRHFVPRFSDLLRQYAFTKTENNSYNFTATVVHAKYPFPINDVWTYAGVLLYEQVICSYLVLYWMCCDSLFAQFATHTAIHIEVLRHDLVSIAENSDETEDSMLKRLANIAERHKRIFEYCEGIERIFSPVIFLSMLLTAICLCTCMHQLETMSSEGNYLEIGKYLVHLASLFVQTIIYCGYSNLLTDEWTLLQTEQMAHAAYNCDWTNRNQKFKRMLQMILMRSQKPFSCTAYGFFPVSLNQVTTIFSTAISYFTVLKTMA
ncbi:putative odorant receptor 92a [Orussus abietinus]|uniref:putative odorant receptor 92a n=1 Tax=Orussus abietinus TaxID=222816 RepID=UPI000C715F2D|nr:putative odorant receptor 92a [Orussus abietinus]